MNDWNDLKNAFSPVPEHYVAHMQTTLDHVEELTVKRRHRITLGILVMALVLMIGTALAYTLISNQYFEDVAKVQFEHGYYEDWTLNEKLTLLQLMKQYGVDMDETEADALLAGGMSDSEREARLDTLIVERYGIDGRTDVISLESILEKELGDFDSWSMEEKAWYSQMLIDSGLMGSDDDVYRMPGDDVITPEEAITVARDEIMAVWELSQSDLTGYQTVWVYRTHATDTEGQWLRYEVYFEPEDESGVTYSCAVGNDGSVLSNEDNPFVMSPAEIKAATAGTDQAFEKDASRIIMEYGDAHGLGETSIMHWPLEDKMAVTDVVRPAIEAQMTTEPDSVSGEFKFYLTHHYGLPDERAMTLDAAVEAAKDALVSQLDVSRETADRCTSDIYYYDVTDPDAPLWKITLVIHDEKEESVETNACWVVRLNAWTGEVTLATPIDFGNLTNEQLINLRY